jgi:hypothetical protein
MIDVIMYFLMRLMDRLYAQNIIYDIIQCLPVQGFEKTLSIHLDESVHTINKLCNYFFSLLFDF